MGFMQEQAASDAAKAPGLYARYVLPGARLAVWIYLYLIALLLLWTFLAAAVTTWRPVVISEPSVEPALDAGDVVLVSLSAKADLKVGDVVVYRSGETGVLVAERVAAVDTETVRTISSTDASLDSKIVARERTTGVSRLVVPFVGLPVIWWRTTNFMALGAWAGLTLLAIGLAIVQLLNAGKGERHSPPLVGQATIRGIRGLVGLLIATQYVIDPGRLDLGRTSPSWVVPVVGMAVLGITNLISALAESARRKQPQALRRIPLVELILDTLLVIGLTGATGTGGIGWLLLALPIIEAATRFRLTGALIHWMTLTGATIGLQLLTLQVTDVTSPLLFGELAAVLDQMAVLLLVVLPGAYLAEQLMSEVLAQRSSAGDAADRSQLLQHVVESSQGVNRIGLDVAQSLAEASLRLGFDVAEVNARNPKTREWETVAEATTLGYLGLPRPGAHGSCLRPHELGVNRLVVDLSDEDPLERMALANCGLSAIVRFNWPQPNGDSAVIRVATSIGTTLRSAQIEALTLLVSQAVVATHNDKLVTELQGMHDRMSIQVRQDSLTGLPNRLAFMGALAAAVNKPPGVSLLFMDLNGFKHINDRLGHDAGDDLLCGFGDRIAKVVGERAELCRLGGDEFTILIPERNPGKALRLADEVLAATEMPFSIGGEQVAVGVSVGIAMSEPQIAGTEILRRADVAMYNAKAAGGRIVSFYSPEMEAVEIRRNQMQTDIGPAILDEGQIELYYQPVLKADTREIVGMEALLRWDHPELGQVSPADAVLVAQQSGLADELTRLVLRLAAVECRRWQSAYGPRAPGYVAVNVSPFELESPALLQSVSGALEYSGLAARHLKIELSERILGPEDGSYRANIDGLRRLGVVVILDDFGEGRTSLAHLRGLPIEGLKLDRSLVTNSIRSESDQIILDSVTRLAHGLKFDVTAEGVETPEHLVRVLKAGCNFVQGYLFSRPLRGDQVDAYITSRIAQAAWPYMKQAPILGAKLSEVSDGA